MDKIEKDAQIGKKKLTYDAEAVEKALADICQNPCGNYFLCANGGRCHLGGGCYLRLGDERRLIL